LEQKTEEIIAKEEPVLPSPSVNEVAFINANTLPYNIAEPKKNELESQSILKASTQLGEFRDQDPLLEFGQCIQDYR